MAPQDGDARAMNVPRSKPWPNIRVNCLAPAAETRLIGTIPGVEVNPDDPDPMRHPKLVSPAVLLMCDEDAPTNKTIHAGNGRFQSSATFVNKAVEFGADVTYEDLLEQKERAGHERRRRDVGPHPCHADAATAGQERPRCRAPDLVVRPPFPARIR